MFALKLCQPLAQRDLDLTQRNILPCKGSSALTSGGVQLQTFVNHTQSGRMGQLTLLSRVENFFNILGKISSWNGTQYM